MVDLHVHSTRSDGTLTPTQLVDYAREKGLTAFALTDHDTVDGLDEAIHYACQLHSQTDADSVPEVIPGIELSSEYQGRDIHIVGLFIEFRDPRFQDYLQDFVASRDTRNRKMCSLLQEEGIDISYESLCNAHPGAVITRAHYAKYMLEHGYVKSMTEAFERYIGDHCPCYIPREKITPAQAVSLILDAGGFPILAHPILYGMSDARLDTLVGELKDAGLMGIEALYSTYHACDERQVRRLAQKYDLLISGGSDFHGANKPGLELGTGYGSLFVPEEVLTQIRQAWKKGPAQ
ncbi:MAG: PHP domain-containing protein [bacterium]|nr:PHP domain-containing protein [bacterium]MCM1374155.1 PHP domain-containing protein [Muribaculum sp.]